MTLFNNDQADKDLEEQFKERFEKDGELNIEEIKKAWAHSQKHINNLETEASSNREELIKRMSYEDLLKKLKPNSDSNDDLNNDLIEPTGNQNTQDVDIEAMLEAKLNQKLNQYQQSSIEDGNRVFVKQELVKAWGDDYVTKLKSRTKELNLNEDYINSLAGSNPTAVLAILDAKPKVKQPDVSAPRSSVVISGGRKGKSKYEEYQEIRKTDPKRYNSPQFQVEMLNVAKTMGDKFYDKG